ncbi:hypothetical protein ACFX2F_031895 [Malus domestica]
MNRGHDDFLILRNPMVFVAGISVGDASCPTSTQLPKRSTPVDAFCRAPALLAGLSGKACWARLVGQV